MPVEIERKFLVRSDGWRERAVRRRSLLQGYLAARPGLSVRVRTADDSEAWITIKAGGDALHRPEYEYPIPIADARDLLGHCRGRLVAKDRWWLDYTGAEWTVDVFTGAHAGLVIAEVEFRQGLIEIERPDWLGDEVTGDSRYYNSTLAAAGGDI